ncbi:hypothetical protein NPIL_213181 [Nephila pilipes]|uniref:Uncharacterized protein n=1 Tax=Nephila pilipes TaxID=299642 RepID=A0A8X6R2K1_NEPPI|nr:hypothetical protein NPIL_213181 [Nephila pilipes]
MGSFTGTWILVVLPDESVTISSFPCCFPEPYGVVVFTDESVTTLATISGVVLSRIWGSRFHWYMDSSCSSLMNLTISVNLRCCFLCHMGSCLTRFFQLWPSCLDWYINLFVPPDESVTTWLPFELFSPVYGCSFSLVHGSLVVLPDESGLFLSSSGC